MGSLWKSLRFERDLERLLGCPAYRATLLYIYSFLPDLGLFQDT